MEKIKNLKAVKSCMDCKHIRTFEHLYILQHKNSVLKYKKIFKSKCALLETIINPKIACYKHEVE